MTDRSGRRLGSLLAGAIAGVLLLAGCGSGGDSGESSSEPAATRTPTTTQASGTEPATVPSGTSSSSNPSGAGDTRVVTGTALGDVEVPANPQRIVALWNVAPQLLELGVRPLGALGDEIDPEYLSPALLPNAADAADLGDVMDIKYEQILSLKPDLIVTMVAEGRPIDTDKLAQIAPTLAWEVSDPLDVWALYPTMADAIGRTAEYEAAKAGVDEQSATIVADHGDAIAGRKAAFVQSYDPGLYELTTNTSLINERAAGVGFVDLSFTGNAEKGADSRILEQSLEDIPALDEADVIFYEANPDGSPAGAIPELIAEPAFAALPAAEQGLLLPMRQFSEYTYAAAALQLEDLAAAGALLAGS